MNAKGLIEKCPFREDSASKAIYVTIARSSKPMSVEDIWRKSKVPLGKVKTLVAAYFNPMHNAPLRRIGVALIRDKDGHVSLTNCKADPKAKRPERGKRKKASGRKAGRKLAAMTKKATAIKSSTEKSKAISPTPAAQQDAKPNPPAPETAG